MISCPNGITALSHLHKLFNSHSLVLDVAGKGRNEADELLVIANADAQTTIHDWLSARGDEPGPLFVSFSPRSRGSRLSMRAIRGIVKAAYKAAGVRGKRKTTHSLRHTAITKAIHNGPWSYPASVDIEGLESVVVRARALSYWIGDT